MSWYSTNGDGGGAVGNMCEETFSIRKTSILFFYDSPFKIEVIKNDVIMQMVTLEKGVVRRWTDLKISFAE